MDADDWLKSVEKKLQMVQCNNREKVLLASHKLSSPTADWWDAYVEAHEEPEYINWPEFRAAFPCTSCSPRSDQAEEERVSKSKIGVHVCEEWQKEGFSSCLASDDITTRGYRVLTFAKCITIMIVVLAVTSGLGSSSD
jgi:hypothetical protein